jgi:hypothetical protein
MKNFREFLKSGNDVIQFRLKREAKVLKQVANKHKTLTTYLYRSRKVVVLETKTNFRVLKPAI